jgi:uridine phosphorylase
MSGGPDRLIRQAAGSSRFQAGGHPRAVEALINPVREAGEAPVTPAVVLTFTQPDYRDLCRLTGAREQAGRIWGCTYRRALWEGTELTLVAPALGAPYAAMVTEKLIALGAARVLALGWCGSLSPQVRIGDLILPDQAFPGDGTSPHYLGEAAAVAPHPALYNLLACGLDHAGLLGHTGPVWSTDAFYRETPALVQSCQDQGILGIDLELAAVLAVSQFRGIAAAALLIVSDELFTLTWQPARGSEAFRAGRREALQLILDAAAKAEAIHV